ncbi:hypothetical protein Bca4012_028264 [Brassica carinata]
MTKVSLSLCSLQNRFVGSELFLILGEGIDSFAMFYGTAVWDPWLIVGQIICLQCSFYLTLGVLMILFLGLRVPRLSLVYFFDYATLTTCTLTGWAVYMVFLVERARKCLDISATLYIIHLFFCIVYGGWPSSIACERFLWIVSIQGFDGWCLNSKRFLFCDDYFTGGDKPYLITGPFRVLDYQTKSYLQTLEGHTSNVSAMCSHPKLPVVITGSEDGTIRILHASHLLVIRMIYGATIDSVL